MDLNSKAFMDFLQIDSDEEPVKKDDADWYQSIADSAMELAKSLDNKIFPDYLWKPVINEYEGDDYIATSMRSFASGLSTKEQRHTITKYEDWIDAMNGWQERMSVLAAQYGGEKTVMVLIKEGVIPNILPTKPRLKKNSRNKKIIKYGIGAVHVKMHEFTQEDLLEIYKTSLPVTAEDLDQTYEVEFEKLPKRDRKLIRAIMMRQAASTRRDTIYREGSVFSSSFDAISSFLAQHTAYRYDSKGANQDNRSLKEIVKEMHRWDGYSEEVIDDRISPNVLNITSSGGTVVYERDDELRQFYKYLVEQGFGINTDGMNKGSVRMVREVGAHVPLSKKERKKLKRRQKRAQEDEDKARERVNEMIAQSLMSGETLFRDPNGDTFSLAEQLAHWND